MSDRRLAQLHLEMLVLHVYELPDVCDVEKGQHGALLVVEDKILQCELHSSNIRLARLFTSRLVFFIWGQKYFHSDACLAFSGLVAYYVQNLLQR